MRHALLIIVVCLSGHPGLWRRCRPVTSRFSSPTFPNRDTASELRARVFVEEKVEVSPRLRLTLSGFAEGLVADRAEPKSAARQFFVCRTRTSSSGRGASICSPASLASCGDGSTSCSPPTSSILSTCRGSFSRDEARRGCRFRSCARASSSRETRAIEAIYVPFFRRGRFDQLDEETSPFNITPDPGAGIVVCLAIGCPTLPPRSSSSRPDRAARNAQGGVRLTATTGRVDWSVAAFRGFEPFGLYSLAAALPGPPPVVRIDQTFPRFTMIGGDFETVFGEWGVRGEGAVYTEDNFQSADLRTVHGHSVRGRYRRR